MSDEVQNSVLTGAIGFLESFFDKAAKKPDGIAVVDSNGEHTFTEYLLTVDRIIGFMRSNGIGKGDRVAIHLGRVMEHLASRIACLCIGASFVSINQNHPQERAKDILDSFRPVLVIDDAVVSALADVAPERYIEHDISDSDEGFAIFTSGTTGKPKGVVHDRSSFRNNVILGAPFLKGARNLIMITDMMFIANMTEMSVNTYYASTIVIPSDQQRRDPVTLVKLVAEYGLEWSSLPPQFVKYFRGSGIRVVFAQGMQAGDVSVEGIDVINTYGATEMCPIMNGSTEKGGFLAMKPLDGCRVVLRGPDGGESDKGEIVATGPAMMMGYLDGPEATQKAITVDEDGTRWLHTGDLGMRKDGGIVIIGRMGSMVKINGQRVEPAEVEFAANSLDRVAESVCLPFDRGSGTQLCLFYSGSIEPDELREILAHNLPSYMVPAGIMRLNPLPHNANGKVDRKALPEPDFSSFKAEYVPPRNDTERMLCGQFAEILGLGRIGVDDDFVRLGGDSIKAAEVVSACRRSGAEIRVQDILQKRTPRNIAPAVSVPKSTDQVYTAESGCPLTGGQLDVYLDIESGKQHQTYIIGTTYPVPEGTSDELTVSRVRRLLGIHPVLRSRIILKDGEPWFSIDAEPEITVSGVPDGNIRRPFVLSESLSRFHIVSGKYIQAAFHHTVSDGLTVGIVENTLKRIFAGEEPEQDIGFLKDASLYATQDISEQEEFFRSMLSDISGDTVPVPDPDGGSGSGHMTLSSSLTEIQDAAKRMSSTPANLLAQGFGYMLSRFTGSDDAVFSHIVNGRDLTSSEQSVGMFVRTLPIALNCRDRSVEGFVKDSSDRIFDSVQNQLCPYHRIANNLGIGFGIIFNHLTGIENRRDTADSDADDDDIIGDLSFDLIRSGNSYILKYSHSSVYSEDTVKRMACAFDRIVSGLLSCARLSEIQYVSQADIELQDRINDTSAPLQYADILDAFRSRVSESPDSVLLTYLERKYAYAEQDSVSDSIASALSSAGISRGDSVAIMVPRSEWYLLCALGVLKTGAAYVPIDTSYPDERIGFMISDSSAKAVLVTPETEERASFLTESTLIDCTSLPSQPFGPVPVSPQDTAVILYTSGTTGRPKGSLITRLAIENHSEYYAHYLGADIKSVFALHTSFSFDAHVHTMYPPLICGQKLVIVPEDHVKDIDALHELILEDGVTHIFLTTRIAEMYARAHKTSQVRYLITGGEKLSLFGIDVPYRIVDGYGPTENLGTSMNAFSDEKNQSSSVGLPDNNVKAYILDSEHRRISYGAVGELYLSGYQLSKGYLNNPEKNRESFFDNPFTSEEGYERMYATGDFFRFLPDGTLGILGRRDGQVKVRGNRVELTEVEACIRSIPSVKDVTVQPITQENGTKELCAYIVAAEPLALSDVQTYVSERKPDYMVPAFVIQLDSIPLNVNGKVDRRALPKPDASALRQEYIAPRNDTERIICEAFSEALGVERIGIGDDFIRLGGDSLKAIRAVSICRQSGIGIKAKDILSKRTVRSLSSVVSDADDMGSYSGAVSPTPLQSLFLDSGTPEERDVFIQHMDLKMDGPVTLGILQKAMRIVADRHDALRLIVSDGLQIRPEGCDCFEVRESTLGSLEKDTDRAFDSLSLQKGIVSELILVEEGYLRIMINHMAVDAVSWNIILSDLSECVSQITEGRGPVLPPRTLSFGRWSLGEYNPSAQEKEFWSSVPAFEPHDFVPEPFTFTLDRDLDNVYGFEPVDILMTAFARAFRSIYGHDPVVRMEGHGRDASVERTVGWFTCLYPLGLKTSDDLLADLFSVRGTRRRIPKGGRGYMHIRQDVPDITFNYLGGTFSYGDGVFTQAQLPMKYRKGPDMGEKGSVNIHEHDGKYVFSGSFDPSADLASAVEDALGTVMDSLKGTLRCPLTAPQLNVYLDEIQNDKGTAYSASGMVPIPEGMSESDIEVAIHSIIKAHPILRGRISEIDGTPYLITDSEPVIEHGSPEGFIRPFVLSEGLCRFRIVPGYILWDMHHTIMDAESRRILISEFRKAFSGIRLDEDMGFLVPAIDSPDQDYVEDAESFFASVLGDERDLPVPDGGTPGRESIGLDIRPKDIERFDTTPGVFFASVFGYTLSRFSGSSGAVFPMTEKGRIPGTENSVGMFVRTFPVSVDCSDATAGEFLEKASESVLGQMSHSALPFMDLARRYSLDMSVSFEYLSDINAEITKVSSGNTGLVADPVSDLMVIVSDTGNGFTAYIEHSAKYSEGFCDRFLRQFSAIASSLTSCARLSEIQYVSQEDVELQNKINDTQVPLQYNDILEAFRSRVKESPDSVLLTYLDRRYTYARQDQISDSIASALTSAGIARGDNVAVMVPRSEWYLLCALGVLKTGAAYVPIDTSYPDERIGFMISDSSAKAVLVTPETEERASSLTGSTLIDCTSLPSQPFGPVPVSPQDTAVILYTSGTTGRPKGSLITHSALENLEEWYVDYTKMGTDDGYGLFASIAFDMHTLMFSPIYRGGHLDIVPEDVRLDIDRLNAHFVSANVTHTFITTNLGKMFASSVKDSTIRLIMYGGEKLGEFTAPDWIGACESYGPSENLAITTAVMVNGRTDSSSTGSPVNNVKVYILDKEHRRVPYGAVGELYLSGYQLSKGYLNNPEKTRESFFDNPFTSEEGYGRMYATGDFFRFLPDGTLGIMGRRDGQVKVRGNRVELTEVEACIRSIPSVRDVTVQPITQDNGTKELCAYIVAAEPLALSDIQSYVSGRKPDYMVPAFVVQLDSIPHNVNGKVDRRALPEPDLSSLRAEYAAPRNDTERILCKAFAEALGVERIGIDDDFIRLGGDSLKATKAASVINSSSVGHVFARDILRKRTVRLISFEMGELNIPSGEYTVESGHPPTMSQKDVIEYMEESGISLNIPVAIELDGLLDGIGIPKAIAVLFKLLPSLKSRILRKKIVGGLRATFESTPDFRMHVVKKDGHPYIVYDAVPEIDILRCDPKEYASRFVRPYGPYDPCLCRFAIVEWKGKNHLFVDMCHLIIDGRSISPLLSRLLSILSGKVPELDDGLVRQAAHDLGYMKTDVYRRRVGEFFELIKDSDDSYEDHKSSENDTGSETYSLKIKKDGMLEIARLLNTYQSDIFYFAFAYALNKVMGKDKLFYIIEDGRGDVDVSDSIGVFIRLHPVWIRKNSDDPLEYAKSAVPQTDKVMSYSDIALTDVRKLRNIWPNVVLQFNNYLDPQRDQLSGLKVVIADDYDTYTEQLQDDGTAILKVTPLKPTDRSPFDIHVNINPMGDGYSVVASYSENQSGEVVRDLIKEIDEYLLSLAESVTHKQSRE